MKDASVPWARRALAANSGVLIAALVFAVLLGTVAAINSGPLTYFDISFMSSGGATSALAAIGQTIVILSGGFDLSAGAVISLVNVFLAQSMDPANMEANVFLWTLAGIGIGMLCGAFNGIFIAFLRLQPIVVTLSTMFIIQGVTLLLMDKPGGFVSPSIGAFYMGDAIPGWIPMPLVVVGGVLLAWAWLKRTRLGTAIYAVGSDPDAAAAVGVRVPFVRFLVYVIAGGCYGFAGVFISAQTGSGDPLVGNPLLLSMFAAVVVGGTRLGGGRGGPLGSAIGAYILIIVVNILLVLNVSAYYSTIAEGTILILAVLAGSLSRSSTLARQLRIIGTRLSARRAGTLVSQRAQGDTRLSFSSPHEPAGGGRTARLLQAQCGCAALCASRLSLLRARRRGDAAVARRRCAEHRLLELARRALVLSRHPRPRPGHGDPHGRPRPLRAVDHRSLRHPARRHGQGLGCGPRLCASGGAAAGLRHRAPERAWASCSSAFHPSS